MTYKYAAAQWVKVQATAIVMKAYIGNDGHIYYDLWLEEDVDKAGTYARMIPAHEIVFLPSPVRS